MGSSKTDKRARRQFTEEFRAGAVRLVVDEVIDVKVIDIFGNDTTSLVRITVG